MDINFHDPSDIPLPPDDVRIRELRVEPLQDRRHLEIKIMTATGHEAASLSIIEAIDYKMQFTVHLKDESASGEYIAELELYYFEAEQSPQDPGSVQTGETHQLPERIKPVDQRQAAFSFAGSPDAAKP